jgi:hypothetical protein
MNNVYLAVANNLAQLANHPKIKAPVHIQVMYLLFIVLRIVFGDRQVLIWRFPGHSQITDNAIAVDVVGHGQNPALCAVEAGWGYELKYS